MTLIEDEGERRSEFLAALLVLWRTKVREPLLAGAAGIVGLLAFALR